MNVFKVSKSFSYSRSTRPRKNDGRTTRRSRDLQLKVKKNEFFKVFNSQNILTKMYESAFLQLKTLIKVTPEKFPGVV